MLGLCVQGPKAVQPANVLQAPLPNAKNFRVYCMYGVGTPTERGYHYLKTRKAGAGGTVHTEWSINSVADDPKSGLVRWVLPGARARGRGALGMWSPLVA